MKETVLLAGLLTLSAASLSAAQTSLFTTTNDFGLFSGGSPVLSSDYYSDTSTVNGLGNSAAAGGTGGIGSLQLTVPGGWGPFSDGPDVSPNQALLSVLDPGAIAAWSAGSGYGAGTLTAYSGSLSFDVFSANLTDWAQFGVLFNYDGNWDVYFSSTVTDLTAADGRTWSHVVVPYVVNAVNAGLTYFNISIAENAASDVVGETIYVDNLQVTPAPEPGTLALAAAGGAVLLFFRRRATPG